MTEQNLAARARASIVLLQERHCAQRRTDGEPHPPTEECPCGLAEASRVIVELLESARLAGQATMDVLSRMPRRYDRSYASPEEERTRALAQAAFEGSEGPTKTEDDQVMACHKCETSTEHTDVSGIDGDAWACMKCGMIRRGGGSQ